MPDHSRLWKPVIFLAAALSIAFNVFSLTTVARGWNSHTIGTVGAEWVESQYFDGRHENTIASLTSNSPLLALGAKPGDRVRFDRIGDRRYWDNGGVQVGLTLIRGEQRTHHVVTTVAVPSRPHVQYGSSLWHALTGIANALFGMLLVVRGKDSPALRALVLSFVLSSFNALTTAQPGGAVREFQRILWFLTLAPLNHYLARFALHYTEGLNIRLRAWWVRNWWLAQALTLACFATGAWFALGFDSPFNARLTQVQGVLLNAISMLVLALGYRLVHGATRQRFGWILAGIGLPVLFNIPTFFPGIWLDLPVFSEVCSILGSSLGIVILTYAMLRHRVFDFGLAVSRTLAFTITSLLLIAVFFALERLAHSLIHLDGTNGDALLNGAIAFVMFFTFNRLHHRVEHAVSHLFFKRWKENAQALRDFVRRAGFFTQPESLIKAFGTELTRFSKGAGFAIYRRVTDSSYTQVLASLPEVPAHLEVDDDLVVTLRTERAAVALADTPTSIMGEWAFPMAQGSTLEGFVILGAKPDGGAYRDDECELLLFASTQVGLDLHALRVGTLQKELDQHAARIQELQRECTVLQQALNAVQRP